MKLATAVVFVLATLTPVFARASPYDDATAKFLEACGASDPDHCHALTPERMSRWQEAGALNEAALDAEPTASAAHTAAMRAAFCFARVGDTTSALHDYDRVINEYGREAMAVWLIARSARLPTRAAAIRRMNAFTARMNRSPRSYEHDHRADEAVHPADEDGHPGEVVGSSSG